MVGTTILNTGLLLDHWAFCEVGPEVLPSDVQLLFYNSVEKQTKTKNKIYKTQVKPLLYNLFNSVKDIINIQYVGLLIKNQNYLHIYLAGKRR